MYYAYSDYLGSLLALTDESGNVVEHYAYDPWGQRRNPQDWTQTDSRTTWIVNRGYTGHEHLDAFSIINMNGRVYDPLTASFFSPDPYVQAPDNWLNYNRYAYAYGNPFKYTDPDGEWVWLAFAIYGAWQMGIQAGVAAENNGGHFWKDGFWKGAIVGFATGAIGASGLAPFGTQWLGATLWGATVGTASQAGQIWAMGGKDYSKVWQGALIGGATGFLASENFGNLVKGQGFVSNDKALKAMLLNGIDKQSILDYFGMDAIYDPSASGAPFEYGGDKINIGFTDSNGVIHIGDDAFTNFYQDNRGRYFPKYDYLESVYKKELFTQNKVLNNIPFERQDVSMIDAKYRNDYILIPEERLAKIYSYKNNGLYPSVKSNNIYDQIQSLENKLFHQFTPFKTHWYDFIYRIPRFF